MRRSETQPGWRGDNNERIVKTAHEFRHRPTSAEYVKRTVTPELVCRVTAGAVPPATDSSGAEPIVFRDREAYI